MDYRSAVFKDRYTVGLLLGHAFLLDPDTAFSLSRVNRYATTEWKKPHGLVDAYRFVTRNRTLWNGFYGWMRYVDGPTEKNSTERHRLQNHLDSIVSQLVVLPIVEGTGPQSPCMGCEQWRELGQSRHVLIDQQTVEAYRGNLCQSCIKWRPVDSLQCIRNGLQPRADRVGLSDVFEFLCSRYSNYIRFFLDRFVHPFQMAFGFARFFMDHWESFTTSSMLEVGYTDPPHEWVVLSYRSTVAAAINKTGNYSRSQRRRGAHIVRLNTFGEYYRRVVLHHDKSAGIHPQSDSIPYAICLCDRVGSLWSEWYPDRPPLYGRSKYPCYNVISRYSEVVDTRNSAVDDDGYQSTSTLTTQPIPYDFLKRVAIECHRPYCVPHPTLVESIPELKITVFVPSVYPEKPITKFYWCIYVSLDKDQVTRDDARACTVEPGAFVAPWVFSKINDPAVL